MNNKASRSAFTLVEIMIVVALIGLLAAIAIPNIFKARETARTKSCINNLRLIDSAKQQWATERNKKSIDSPNSTSLYAYIGRTGNSSSWPQCPDGSVPYVINNVKTPPECPNVGVYTNHFLPD